MGTKAKQSQPDNLSTQYRCERCWASKNIDLYRKSHFLEDEASGFVILCNKCKSEAPQATSRKIFEDLFLGFSCPKELIKHYDVQNEVEAKKMWCKEHGEESADYDILSDFEIPEIRITKDEEEIETKETEKNAPYGYVLNDDTLKINLEEAKVVKCIFEKYLEGNTMERISRTLDQKVSLNTALVREILKNPVYAGFILFGAEVVKSSHEPIIEIETFNKVQKKIVRNIRNPKYMYKPLELKA